jgi:hypothetical protein
MAAPARIALSSFRALSLLSVLIVLQVVACGALSSTTLRPCASLTRSVAAQISGDPAITNQLADVAEPITGYVACTFADTRNEADSVEVQLKRVAGGMMPAALRAAATFFSRGEPVQPFQSFPVAGLGAGALGESTPGVAFVVFARGDVLAYVGARSAFRGLSSLRASAAQLARQVAGALTSTT